MGGDEGFSGVWPLGRGRGGTVCSRMAHVGDGFMVPSGRCGMGGPSWHRARAGKGALGHSGELPPSCCLAQRGGWRPLVSMSPA